MPTTRNVAFFPSLDLWPAASPAIFGLAVRAIAFAAEPWRILLLTEPTPRNLPQGTIATIVAPGTRDHDAFAGWLQQEIVLSNASILEMSISYRLQTDNNNVFQEDAIITFALSGENALETLLNALQRPNLQYRTDTWKLAEWKPLH